MNSQDIISLISRIREKANRAIISEMSAHGVEDIVTSHGDIIYALFHREKMTMAEIAEKIVRDKSTVTALVDKLVRLGYIKKEKDDEDNRVVFVSLTTQGHALKPVFEAISQRVLDDLYRGITAHEKDELLRLLNKIYDNL